MLQSLGPGQRGVAGGGGGGNRLRGVLPRLSHRRGGLVTCRPDGGVRGLVRLADLRGRPGADRVQACLGVLPCRFRRRGGLGAGLLERCLRLRPGRRGRVAFGFQSGDPLLQRVDHADRLGRYGLRLVPGDLRLTSGLLGSHGPGDRLGDALGRLRLDRFHPRLGGGYVAESGHLPDEGVQRLGEVAGQRGDLLGHHVGPPARARGALRAGLADDHSHPGRSRPGLPGELPSTAVGRQPVVGGIVAVRGWTPRPGRGARRLTAPRVGAPYRCAPVDRRVLGHAHRCPFSLPASRPHRPDKNAPGRTIRGASGQRGLRRPCPQPTRPAGSGDRTPSDALWPASDQASGRPPPGILRPSRPRSSFVTFSISAHRCFHRVGG